jgi:hypothetical protein
VFITEQDGGFRRLDGPLGEDEVDAVRQAASREVLGAEGGRAGAVEHIRQAGILHELGEQSTVTVHVEVAAHHRLALDSSYDLRQRG